MAQLLPTKTSKADAPKSAEASRIETARAGMAAADGLWRQKASNSPVPVGPVAHLSGLGVSSMPTIATQAKAQKADALADLPLEVRRRAEGLADGQKRFLALIHERHAATKQAVSFTTADAAAVMDLPSERADKTVAGLERAGLIVRRYNALGSLAGYVPA